MGVVVVLNRFARTASELSFRGRPSSTRGDGLSHHTGYLPRLQTGDRELCSPTPGMGGITMSVYIESTIHCSIHLCNSDYHHHAAARSVVGRQGNAERAGRTRYHMHA